MSYLDEDFEQAMRTTPEQSREREERRARGQVIWRAHLEKIGHQLRY